MIARARPGLGWLRGAIAGGFLAMVAVGLSAPGATPADATSFGPLPHDCKGAADRVCMIQTYLGQVHLSPHVAHIGDTMTATVEVKLSHCFQFTPCVSGVAWGGLGVEVDAAGRQTHGPCAAKVFTCTFVLNQSIVDQGRQAAVPSGGNVATTGTVGGGWEALQVNIGSGIGNGLSTDYFGVLAAGENIDEASLGVHTAPSVTTTLRSPSQVSFAPLDLARSALLAAALLFLVGFPAQLFNSTMQAHYDEIIGWFGFLGRFKAIAQGEAKAEVIEANLEANVDAIEDDLGPPETPSWLIAVVFIFSAFVGSFIDPKFGLDLPSFEGFLGALGAIVFTTYVYTGIAALLIRRTEGRWGRFRLYPAGIVVVLLCAAISKLTAAQPGYLYGVVLGYSLGRYQIAKPRQGRLVAASSLVVLSLSLAFWWAWQPVKGAAESSNAFPLVVLSALMASVFLGGMTSLLFGLAPMSFLDGEKLFAWRRAVWAGLFSVGVFLFVHVVLNAAAGTAHPGRNYGVAVALFLAFGLFSTGFWAFFRFRPVGAPQPAFRG